VTTQNLTKTISDVSIILAGAGYETSTIQTENLSTLMEK